MRVRTLIARSIRTKTLRSSYSVREKLTHVELPRFEPLVDPRPQDIVWPELEWPPAAGIALRGKTIELTPLDIDADSSSVYPALADEQVWTHMRFLPTSVESFATEMRALAAKGFFIFKVTLLQPVNDAAAGEVVGITCYLDIAIPDARLEIGGTAYSPRVWGSAVNPEAKLLLLQHAFESLNAGRVQIKTDIRNVRSQQAIARLGATYEGVWRRAQRRQDGTMRDSVMFSVIFEDWPVVKQRLLSRVKG
jgi:RimJ/RimL family protein N-acetyltransferase